MLKSVPGNEWYFKSELNKYGYDIWMNDYDGLTFDGDSCNLAEFCLAKGAELPDSSDFEFEFTKEDIIAKK